jgi:sucrose phosphorylase
VRLVRLDAIGYVVKRAGTSCFMVQPELDEVLDWLRSVAAPLGLHLLTEVHGDVATQRALAGGVALAYDFAFPGVVLGAVLSAQTDALIGHLRASPRGMVTTLDSHDGIPIQPDLDGALSTGAARRLTEACLRSGGNLSRVLVPASLPEPAFDVHQANATIHSILGRDDELHLLARAIQLFAPGMPQVYYVGLLAGDNDPDAVRQTGDGRAVNRHDFTASELATALERPVVARTLELLRLRRAHPAFTGDVEIGGGGRTIQLSWRHGAARCTLRADLARRRWTVDATPVSG